MSKFKEHMKKHKTVYISTATGLLGIGGGYVAFRNVQSIQKAGQVNILSTRPTFNNVQISLVERSTPSKPLFDPVKKIAYSSKNEAMVALSVTRAVLDRLIKNGDLESMNVL